MNNRVTSFTSHDFFTIALLFWRCFKIMMRIKKEKRGFNYNGKIRAVTEAFIRWIRASCLTGVLLVSTMKNGFRRNKNGEIRGRLLSRTFTTTKHEISLWRKLFAKWPLTLTVGIGVPTFLTVLQRTYATRSKQVEKKGIVDNIMVKLYFFEKLWKQKWNWLLYFCSLWF